MRVWAEWFAIVSGAIYIPFEIYELVSKPTFVRAGILIFNVAIVAYLLCFRKQQHQLKIEEQNLLKVGQKRNLATDFHR